MPFIILDRDGVINYDSDYYIKSPEECVPIPGSLEAIARLNKAGYQIFVATNQSGIARGYYDLPMLERIHSKLTDELAKVGGEFQEIFFCPHHPDENCGCRKPQPGLFYQIADKYPVNLQDTYFIGDTKTDVEVAEQVGCKPILILSEKGNKALQAYPELKQIQQFPDLAAAVDFILQADEKKHEASK